MSFPRWLIALFTLIAVNSLAVAFSSAWHLAQTSASEKPPQSEAVKRQVGEPIDQRQEPRQMKAVSQSAAGETSQQLSNQITEASPKEDDSETIETEKETQPLKQSAALNVDSQPADSQPADAQPRGLEGLATPNLPGLGQASPPLMPAEVPSLATPEELERDPIFQEFQSMFEGSNTASSYEDNGVAVEVHSETYFESLKKRLRSVQQITQAANQMVSEAQRFHREGRQESADKLMMMTLQMREIAAQLLVSEL